MTRLVVVGGSDAGISAGLRARQVDPTAQVTLVLEDSFPNYSVCGLPFFISGETADWRSLAHRSLAELERAGLELMTDTHALEIDGSRQSVMVEAAGGKRELSYDRLVIATGAEPVRPKIEGLEASAVHLLHSMSDSFRVREALDVGARSAVIIGGGYIGLEMADAFRHRGLDVTLVEQLGQVMPSLDPTLAEIIREQLQAAGVTVVTGAGVEAVEPSRQGVVVRGDSFEARGDVALVVVGVRPRTELARSAGLELGARSAIRVDRRMGTSETNILAAGDCVETWHRISAQPSYLPLGTTAHKQGRIAGENAVGGSAEFGGSLGTQVVKVFDLAVARTGLRDAEAEQAGFQPRTVEVEEWDHKAYYPGAHTLSMRITGDRRTGRLLGAQIVGDHRAQVAKRIDIFAAALFSELLVGDLVAMDLSYTPPFAAPWDAVQSAADAWLAGSSGAA